MSLPLAALDRKPFSDDEARRIADAHRALADPVRVQILRRLVEDQAETVCVCEFVEMFDLTQPSISYHLGILLKAGLVDRTRRGSYAHYKLSDGAAQRISVVFEAS
jgi:ArsR family transcriptional regulator